MSYDFDVLVIGSGPAGSKVAKTCVKEGKKTAVADFLFGGTCALRGCTPKKAMESVTSLFWESYDLRNSGFPSSVGCVNWKKLMAHKDKFTALMPTATKRDFRELGIKVLQGIAAFKDKNTITVSGKNYTAKTIVIATGSKPVDLPIEGNEHLITSEDFFELDELPIKITFVGGGYIAFELAHIAAACGAEVTILSKDELPLGAFDPALAQMMVKATLAKGIDVRLGFKAEGLEKMDAGFKIKTIRGGNKRPYFFECDLAVNTAGRAPNVGKLDLENTKINLNNSGAIPVNEYLQSQKHDHIFALGDVTGKLPFTEICGHEAEVVAQNILNPKKKTKPNYDGFPVTLFTYPKLSAVGKSEKELREEGIDFETVEDYFDSHLLERAVNNSFAKYRVFIEKKGGKVLGAHVLSTKADDVINMFAFAMQQKTKAKDIENLLLSYPTATNLFKYMVS